MRISILYPDDLDAALSLIDAAYYDLTWYWGGQPESSPAGRLCVAALASPPGSRREPGAGRPATMGAWTDAPRELVGLVVFERRPDRVLFPPWSPVVAPALSDEQRLDVGRALIDAALEADAAVRPAPVPARSVIKFETADRERAVQIVRQYEMAGFTSRPTHTLTLTRERAAAVRPLKATASLPGGLRWSVVPIDPGDSRHLELLTWVCIRAAEVPYEDPSRARGADPEAVRRWLGEVLDARRGGPAPGLWRLLTAHEPGRERTGEAVPLQERVLTGFILVNDLGGGLFNIAGMGVVPDYRRAGLGRRLLESTTDILWDRGARAVTAVVDGRNEPALRLFAAAGFVETARRVSLVRAPGQPGSGARSGPRQRR